MYSQTSLRRLGRNHFNLSILECGAKMKTKKLLRKQLFIYQQKSCLILEKIGNSTMLQSTHIIKTLQTLL